MRVGSMFAGIGGICTAFKRAGADLVWANEIDKYACITYRHNFGTDILVECDIRVIDLTAILEIDVLTAGFPCQSFSIMGNQKGFADPRGTMYFEILRVIDIKRPKVILLENVKNLVSHDDGRTFRTISKTLTDRGYAIKHSVLGAHAHANIPQYRDRIFIAGFLDNDSCERYAFPSKIALTKRINDVIDRNATVKDFYYYTPTNRYHEKLNERMQDGEAIYRIDDSGVAMRAWRIAPTLKANMGTYHDRVPLIRDHRGIRKLTPYDCLALQGFPVEYQLTKIPLNEIYKQLGNTVCVPVVERIAREIIAASTSA